MNKWTRWVFRVVTAVTGVAALSGLAPLFADSNKTETLAVTSSVSETKTLQTLIQATKQQVLDLAGKHPSVSKIYDPLMGLITTAVQEEHSLSVADVEKICGAIVFAAEQHRTQTRKNAEKTPYICHPLEVTYDLMKIGQVRDLSTIIGAVLHDTALEKGAALKEINQQFGAQAARLVKEVGSHPISARESHQRDLLIHAGEQSTGSVQIELADLLYSLKELNASPPAHWKKEQVDHYFQWAQSVVNRFPNEANTPLSQAVNATIQAYWDRQ